MQDYVFGLPPPHTLLGPKFTKRLNYYYGNKNKYCPDNHAIKWGFLFCLFVVFIQFWNTPTVRSTPLRRLITHLRHLLCDSYFHFHCVLFTFKSSWHVVTKSYILNPRKILKSNIFKHCNMIDIKEHHLPKKKAF